jgi:F0F1-type ATP synthase membrane subunit b/b'
MLAAIFLLGCLILGVLVTNAVLLYKQNKQGMIGDSISNALEQLDEAARAHVQVTTVISLVEAMHENPQLIDNITPYTRDVMAAALVNKVNTLAASLQDAETKLARARKSYAFYAGDVMSSSAYGRQVSVLENLAAELQTKLEEAVTASQTFNRPRVVR